MASQICSENRSVSLTREDSNEDLAPGDLDRPELAAVVLNGPRGSP